jgi:hypothetical protein
LTTAQTFFEDKKIPSIDQFTASRKTFSENMVPVYVMLNQLLNILYSLTRHLFALKQIIRTHKTVEKSI